MKSPTEIHLNQEIELQVYHMLLCCWWHVNAFHSRASGGLVLSFPCLPDVSVTVSDPTAELLPAFIFATV